MRAEGLEPSTQGLKVISVHWFFIGQTSTLTRQLQHSFSKRGCLHCPTVYLDRFWSEGARGGWASVGIAPYAYAETGGMS